MIKQNQHYIKTINKLIEAYSDKHLHTFQHVFLLKGKNNNRLKLNFLKLLNYIMGLDVLLDLFPEGYPLVKTRVLTSENVLAEIKKSQLDPYEPYIGFDVIHYKLNDSDEFLILYFYFNNLKNSLKYNVNRLQIHSLKFFKTFCTNIVPEGDTLTRVLLPVSISKINPEKNVYFGLDILHNNIDFYFNLKKNKHLVYLQHRLTRRFKQGTLLMGKRTGGIFKRGDPKYTKFFNPRKIYPWVELSEANSIQTIHDHRRVALDIYDLYRFKKTKKHVNRIYDYYHDFHRYLPLCIDTLILPNFIEPDFDYAQKDVESRWKYIYTNEFFGKIGTLSALWNWVFTKDYYRIKIEKITEYMTNSNSEGYILLNIKGGHRVDFSYSIKDKSTLHPFHIVDPSPWPFFMGFSLLTLLTSFVMYLHNYAYWGYLSIVGFFYVLLIMILWFRDIVREGTFEGHHTKRVQKGFLSGMQLFIASEVMFFISFFWAYFHSSLSPTIWIGAVWPPQGLEVLNPWSVPLLNTIILLTSGATVTVAHNAFEVGSRKLVLGGLISTCLLGVIFTLCQILEYREAPFTIADSIYGSIFYMATGFHGFHVLVGTILLIVCLGRTYAFHFTKEHHVGFIAAAWYWHFVDVVWLFLFVSIYWWGS